MRYRAHLWFVLSMAAWMVPFHGLQAAGAQRDVAQIIRLMGYEGGIHNFKNYVLRGKQEYYTAARENFTQILEIIPQLKHSAELTLKDQEALGTVQAVVESYNTTLDRLAGLRAKGWRTEDIDRTVIIDDTPAKAALDTLRAKWSWSDFEEMEFQLGYGKAIHNFKNYLLRGQERYHTGALQNFLTVDALITRQLSLPEFANPQSAAQTSVDRGGKIARQEQDAYDLAVRDMENRFRQDRSALEVVERVIRSYRNHLQLINKLIATQTPVQQIDQAIKIYNTPAKQGLARLRQAESYLFSPAARGFTD
jgi:hypothetical protein